MGGRLTFPGGGYYHATKHAIEALTDALRFEVEGFGIDVALIQPGLIRTKFSEVVAEKLPETGATSPYRRFLEEVKRITRDAYRTGVMSKLAGEPDDGSPYDRDGVERSPAQDALSGHAFRSDFDGPARAVS